MKKVAIFGDSHITDTNLGLHINFSQECLYYYQRLNQLLELNKVDVSLGLGDLTHTKLRDLDFRLKFESLLEQQNKIVKGNHFELKGNHDESTKGTTEWEFYVAKGVIKNQSYIDVENVRIHLINFRDISRQLDIDNTKKNIACVHANIRFRNIPLSSYLGESIIIEDCRNLDNIHMLFSGHIHTPQEIVRGYFGNNLGELIYPGCITRPSYAKEEDYNKAYVYVLSIDGSDIKVESIEFPLIEEKKAFNMNRLIEVKQIKEQMQVFISKLKQKDTYNFEPILTQIDNLTDIEDEVRQRAKELYNLGVEKLGE